MKDYPCRGVRNNNPFNIVKSTNNWIGKMKCSSDPVFEQFCDIRYGIRAGLIVLRSYIRLHNLLSVHSIISRFAPSCENNTKAYIKFVQDYMRSNGFSPDGIRFKSDQFVCMCRAILIYESKYECTPNFIFSIIKHYNL